MKTKGSGKGVGWHSGPRAYGEGWLKKYLKRKEKDKNDEKERIYLRDIEYAKAVVSALQKGGYRSMVW